MLPATTLAVVRVIQSTKATIRTASLRSTPGPHCSRGFPSLRVHAWRSPRIQRRIWLGMTLQRSSSDPAIRTQRRRYRDRGVIRSQAAPGAPGRLQRLVPLRNSQTRPRWRGGLAPDSAIGARLATGDSGSRRFVGCCDTLGRSSRRRGPSLGAAAQRRSSPSRRYRAM